jgi:ATP-dependent protease La (Lon)-like substrate-binding protein
LSYHYAMVVRSGQTWPFDDIWQSDRLRLLVQTRWRPDADMYETATTVEIIVDLTGVEEDDFEVQLFEDALVVEGRRRLPSCQEGAVVFPLTAVPLAVGQPRSVWLIDDVMRGNRLLVLVAQHDAKAEPAMPDELHRVGTVGMIQQLGRVPDGSVRLVKPALSAICTYLSSSLGGNCSWEA